MHKLVSSILLKVLLLFECVSENLIKTDFVLVGLLTRQRCANSLNETACFVIAYNNSLSETIVADILLIGFHT